MRSPKEVGASEMALTSDNSDCDEVVGWALLESNGHRFLRTVSESHKIADVILGLTDGSFPSQANSVGTPA